MLLLNLFSNKLDNQVDSSDNKDMIPGFLIWNVISFQILTTRWNKNASLIKIDKYISETKRDISYSEIEKELRNTNEIMSDVKFLYWGIIIWN